jgi:SMI1 / KNR4 family protein
MFLKKLNMINYLKELKQSDEFEYYEGANAEEIKFIEETLGICFPDAYLEDFLSLGLED